MKSSTEFLHLVQNDPGFLERAQTCASDEERVAFLWNEGFEFTAEELEAALRLSAFFNGKKPVHKTKDQQKTEQYKVFLKVTEINGQPLAEAAILDISAWGGNLESLTPIPPDSPVEISFTLNGGEKKKQVRLSGRVVWSGPAPVSKRPRRGRQIYASIDPCHREGDLPQERVKSAIQQQDKEISDKEFLNIREFARKLGVHWFTVWRWTVENRIKFKQVKSGCKILIPASELAQFQGSPE